MELYIRIKDGQPFDHPILADNFRAAFPHVDTNNLPPEFARFERVARPIIGAYEKNQRVQYELGTDGVWTDVWYTDPMTAQEKVAKQDQVKARWAEEGYASWVFDEDSCTFQPPVPYPTDDKAYRWDEDTMSWQEIILPPMAT